MAQSTRKTPPRQQIVTMTPPDPKIEHLHKQGWRITRATAINDKGREIQFDIQRTPNAGLGIFANDANAGQALLEAFRTKRKEIVRPGANDNEAQPPDVAEAAKYFPAKTQLSRTPLIPDDPDPILPYHARAAYAAGTRAVIFELQHREGEKLKVALIFRQAAEACAWFLPTRDVPKVNALVIGYGVG